MNRLLELPFVLPQGPIQTETGLFYSAAACVIPPFVGGNPSTGVSGKCLPPLRALTPPPTPLCLSLALFLSCAPSALRGRKFYLLEEAIHPSIFPLPMQPTAAPHV